MNLTANAAAILVISVLCSPQTGFSQELATGEKDTIFIGKLNTQASVKDVAKAKGYDASLSRTSDSLESQLTTALNATRVFQIVERSRMKDVQLEQDFAAVMGDPNDKNAAKALKMAGAKFIFIPEIDGFDEQLGKKEFPKIDRISISRTLFLSAVVRVVDTTTGKLLPDSPSIQLSKVESAEMVPVGSSLDGDRMLVEVAKEMAEKLSQGVVQLLRPAKVLAVTGKQVLINRGEAAGFRNGDSVEIYAAQEIKDSDTGETFRNEVLVGSAKITRSDAKQSFAMIAGEDTGIAKDCIVRVLKPTAAPAYTPPMNPTLTPGSSEKPLTF